MPEPTAPAQAASPGEPPPDPTRSLEEFAWARRWTGAALALLIASLFVPWWMAVGQVTGNGFLSPPETLGLGIFAPAWSPFALSPLGTKLSNHFWNLLVLLVGALSLLALARAYLGRPRRSAHLLWGASAFTATGLLLFSLFFPRIGYAGRIFWPAGSAQVVRFDGAEIALAWSLFHGWILAVVSLVFQIRVAVRLTRSHLLPASPSGGTQAPSYARRPQVEALRVAVVPIAFAVLAATIWGASTYSPVISSAGLRNDWDFTHKSFEPGDRATVWGTVTDVRLVPTSYGPFTILTFGPPGGDQIALAGDQRARYLVGSTAWIPLQFRAYTYNGIPFTWADEGVAPIPLTTSIAVVIGAVSNAMGITLVPETPILGSTRLVVRAASGFPMGEFRAGLVEGSFPYIGETAALASAQLPPNLADRMVPLADGVSENGTFAFVDENGNGLLDWGDAFELDLPATARDTELRTYVLVLVGPVGGVAYILLRERGPLLVDFFGMEPARPLFFVSMPPDTWNVTMCDSRVRVVHRLGIATDPATITVRFRDGETDEFREFAATANASLPNLASVRFLDGGARGVLDEGDEWRFHNLTRYGSYEFAVLGADRSQIVSARWVCGVGMNVASYPRVATSLGWQPATRTARIDVTAVDWVPAGHADDYRVLLMKNGTAILPADGEPEPLLGSNVTLLGPSSDGAATVLTFYEADGYVGPGDWFTVESCAPGSTYELLLYYGYASTLVADLTWTT